MIVINDMKPVKTHHVHHHLYVEDGVSKYKMEQCDKAQQCAKDAKGRKKCG